MAQNGPRIGKGGRILREPKPPRKGLNKFKTSFYQLYDPALHRQTVMNTPRAKFKSVRNYNVFNEYLLYSDPTTTEADIHAKIPKRGVRLDDLTVALVLRAIDCPKSLNEWWPGEFDVNGMPKAERIPLGHAAKRWVSAGDVDLDGNVATEADEGYYYLWWKGLQVLMGKEGHDAGMYMVRPSWELDQQTGFSFKLTHRAVVQALL
ncbi:MAG: hypothetical protein LQ344_001669 [Seirophora lacunosa]|nr:MAG: hypothetical protein LQ344_001669 [Seirophora lacunosa]